ncbi:isoleucine-tRNA ligase (IARS1) [Vairimorpha necatrix]|uniref:Probable isoleucine--tRNA ligase, cytoplasmic n=1 Tax=Vairimorpha necatrix TaxID=6039 RepID=A0AAX4J8P4_9MICR
MDFNFNFSMNEIESKILKFWKDNKCFEKSNELSKNKKRYTFYDGPPFATGLPHYGHILAGTVKDIVTRYQYQHDKHVDRRFGWDCHGLPVEFEIDKKLGINQKSQILEMGIDKYNAECKSIVMKFSNEWKDTVEKMGRWVDFDNGYKTMDRSFMASVWYIFSQLYKKGFIYRGYRVMPFSSGCMTTLSNSEAKSNYKEVKDISVVVSFPLKTPLFDKEVSLLAWTTTPWTLPSNCGLIINKNFEYQIFEINKKYYVMLSNKIDEWFKKDVIKHESFKGEILLNLEYEQPFEYFEELRNRGFFRVLEGNFVSDQDGTGIVHAAPAFGEEDYNCFVENKLIKQNDMVPCPIDENGRFTEEVEDFKGIYIKDADKKIIDFLKEKILIQKKIIHNYPFCWRSETPLIYKLVPSWFIRVSDSVDKLVKNNEMINWIPKNIKYKKFGHWLENAKDWAFSRTRFWGTPIPIWANEDFSEILCVESADELSKLSGREISDLHMEFIDDIVLTVNGKSLRRIPEVFDCWFESGSMPYGQNNWPFKETDKFDLNLLEQEIDENNNLINQEVIYYDNKKLENFPADFIGEGIDQTRGWFYTLHVISTLLFDKPAFKNVIVNGIVLAENNKKMSKKDKNYPDPNIVMRSYGADSLRMYLVSSPVVEADNLTFREDGVKDVSKSLIIPWMNILKFYNESAPEKSEQELELDSWIKHSFNSFVSSVSSLMDKYELSKVQGLALKFIDDLSNWYLRIHREEIRAGNTRVLSDILKGFSVVLAPFVPFFSEYCYQCVLSIKARSNKKETKEIQSVHFEIYPKVNKIMTHSFNKSKEIIDTIRYLRDKHTISLKTPLKEVRIISETSFLNEVEKYANTIIKECHLLNLKFINEKEVKELKIEYKAKPCFENLKKDEKSMGKNIKMIKNLNQEEIKALNNANLSETMFDIKRENVLIEKNVSYPTGLCKAMKEYVILIDDTIDNEVIEKKTAREFNSFIQKLRKSCGLKIEDSVNVEIANEFVKKATLKFYSINFSTQGKIVSPCEDETRQDLFTFENKKFKVILRTQ